MQKEDWKTSGKVSRGVAMRETEASVLVLCTVFLNGLMDPLSEPLDDWQIQERREVCRPLAVPGGVAAAAAAGVVATVGVGGGVVVLVVGLTILIP